MEEPTPQNAYSNYVKQLLPLFKQEGADLLQLAHCLLRVKNENDGGWDSLDESRQMLEDLIALNKADLSPLSLDNIEKTHLRLHLISYVHLTEMSTPYFVLANLLRIRCGLNYSTNPFRAVDTTIKGRPIAKSQKKQIPRKPLPSAHHKIAEIKMLAVKAGLSGIADLFDDFYMPPLRNSIAHSDYVLAEGEIRIIGNQIKLKNNPHLFTSKISFDELGEIIGLAYEFYTAFFMLESFARLELGKLANQTIYFDEHNKGILEFQKNTLGFLSGFVIHWPNLRESYFKRENNACQIKHLDTDPHDEITFVHGPRNDKGDFSPLVPKGSKPKYTPSHTDQRPLFWKT